MFIKRVQKIIHYLLFLSVVINLSVTNVAHSAEFEIDEIITAIKNEIKTANISELGSPNFIIETVNVALTLVSTVTEKGALAIKIVGYDKEANNEELTSKSFHILNFSFKPSTESGYSPEISIGLVEPIKKVKASLRKAYNSPPTYRMEGFTFKIEFAIEKDMDRGIRFTVFELNELKAININTHYITIHMKIQE